MYAIIYNFAISDDIRYRPLMHEYFKHKMMQ